MPEPDLQILINIATPIYAQIVDGVRDLIATGRLAPGDKLPSHRDLALRLAIAPLTVKRAYDELERQGLVASRHGLGTYITETAAASAPSPALRELVERLVVEARISGQTLRQTAALIAAAWKKKVHQ